MGISGHKPLLAPFTSLFRPGLNPMVKKPNPWLVVGLVAAVGYAGWSAFKPKPPAAAPVNIVKSITALGRITPEG